MVVTQNVFRIPASQKKISNFTGFCLFVTEYGSCYFYFIKFQNNLTENLFISSVLILLHTFLRIQYFIIKNILIIYLLPFIQYKSENSCVFFLNYKTFTNNHFNGNDYIFF